MLSFAYENQGTNTYLVYEIGANDELDTMSLGMLTNNTIPGLAAASFTQMDTTKYIKYNVSAKISAAQLFSGAVNKKRLIGVFTGIVDAMLSAEDYMLDINSLLLDLDYIFADVSSCETVVVCLPILNAQSGNPDLGRFFKNIIFNTQFDQSENCDHVAKILNYLNSNPVLSLESFKELLDGIAKESAPVKPVQPKPAAQSVVQQSVAQQAPVTKQPVVQQSVVQQSVVQQEIKHIPEQPKVTPQPAISVPPVKQTPVMEEPKVSQEPQGNNEKPMTMFYLLQHYNKENAAIYKAQQDAKKAQKGTKEPAPAKPAKAAQKKAAAPANSSFAIPGQPEAVKPMQQPNPAPVQRQAPAWSPQPAVQQSVVSKPAVAPQPKVQQAVAPNFGETTILNAAIGETTTLDAIAAAPTTVNPYLIRTKNNERIPVNKPVFRIGKERSYVDCFIGDNTAISRSHANIMNHNGEYFVVDTNSTNHTYVNGGMIQSNVEVKLSHGTKIRLANEDFEFRLY